MLRSLRAVRRCAAAAGATALLAACTSSLPVHTPPAPSPPTSPFRPVVAPSNLFPGARFTGPTGIRGPLLSATIALANGHSEGALENLAHGTWTPINVPGAASTAAYGPEIASAGYRVVGSFMKPGSHANYGFIYDAQQRTYTILKAPALLCAPRRCNEVIAHSAYGRSSFVVVGNYDAVPAPSTPAHDTPATGHAFLYRSARATWQTIDVPHALSTTAYGVWIDAGHVIVAGGYADARGDHAYVRDLTTGRLLTYDFPGAVITHFEGLSGAGGLGNYTLAGDFADPGSPQLYGFFLSIDNWQPQAPVVLGALTANSVSGRVVVGIMKTNAGPSGYLIDVPQ